MLWLATMLGLGLALRPSRPSADTGGGGGGDYVAKAVSFDGSAQINRLSSLTGVSDSPFGLLAVWTKGSDIFNNDTGCILRGTNDSNQSIVIYDEATTVDDPYIPQVGAFVVGPGQFSDQDVVWRATYGSPAVIPAIWTLQIFSWDTSSLDNNGNCVIQAFYGDVDVTDANNKVGGEGSTQSTLYTTGTNWCSLSGDRWNNGPLDSVGPLGEFSDYQFFIPASFVDLTIQSNRRRFIDAGGKPVDPASAALAFGSQVILHSGDHSTFATNQGTGGAFTLTGTLTNAPTSPSD